MSTPRASTLFRIAGMTEAIANQIRGMIAGDLDPCDASDVARDWAGRCYHRPGHVELVMCAADDLLETHGVEAIFYRRPDKQDRTGWLPPRFEYCNTGDSYAPTLCYDHGRARFVVAGWADLIG